MHHPPRRATMASIITPSFHGGSRSSKRHTPHTRYLQVPSSSPLPSHSHLSLPSFTDATTFLTSPPLSPPSTPPQLRPTPWKTFIPQVSHAIDLKLQRNFMTSLPDTRSQARMKSATLARAGDWLNAMPSYNLGLHMRSLEFRVACHYRLGIPLFTSPGPCVTCGHPSDVNGDHAITTPQKGRESPDTTG